MRVAIFLRAINTGDRRVTNAELIECVTGAGLADVSAFQAAGNLLASADDGDTAPAVAARVEAAIADRFRFVSEPFVRSADELVRTVADVPFSADQVARTEGRIQVTFLRHTPTDDLRRAVAEMVSDDDLVEIGEDVWYWLPRAGISTSTLKVGAIERLLGPMTMRTLATVEKVLAKLDVG